MKAVRVEMKGRGEGRESDGPNPHLSHTFTDTEYCTEWMEWMSHRIQKKN